MKNSKKNKTITMDNFKKYLFKFNLNNLEELFEFVHLKMLGLNFNEEILIKLSSSKNWYLRYLIARNKNCPPNILDKLRFDEEKIVRKCATSNKNISIKTST